MKGPYQRLKFDLRRLWECPACKRRERTSGAVTYCHCTCQMKQLGGQLVVMKLIADDVQRLTPPVVIEHAPSTASEPVGSAEQIGPMGSLSSTAAAERLDTPG